MTDTEALRGWLDKRAENFQFSGVATLWRDGEQAFVHAAGLAHRGLGVHLDPQSRFAVASVSKVVTAATALRLVAAGQVDLAAPLMEVLPTQWQPASLTREHTLHHLLSHTSGLGDYHDQEATNWDSFTSCWDRIPTYHLRGPADMVPLFRDKPSVASPGAEYRYADVNFLLAGLVIEAVTGHSIAEVAKREVLDVASMADTAFEQLDAQPRALATGYLATEGDPQRWISNIYSVPAGSQPDGGMITTADDLARLITALENGVLLPADLHTAMTTPKMPLRDGIEGYGYGCEVTVESGSVTILSHGGLDPGVSSRLTHYRKKAITVVVLCNHDRGSWPVSIKLADAYGVDDPRV